MDDKIVELISFYNETAEYSKNMAEENKYNKKRYDEYMRFYYYYTGKANGIKESLKIMKTNA